MNSIFKGEKKMQLNLKKWALQTRFAIEHIQYAQAEARRKARLKEAKSKYYDNIAEIYNLCAALARETNDEQKTLYMHKETENVDTREE